MSSKTGRFPRLADPAEDTSSVPAAMRQAFDDDWLAPWLRAQTKLRDAGYGEPLVKAYGRAGLDCVGLIGAETVIGMADTLSSISIKSGVLAAERLCQVAPFAARAIGDAPRFRNWLNLMQRFAAMAPESTLAVLDRMEELLTRLNVAQLEAWLLAGIRQAGVDGEKRLDFFSLENPDALRLLEREAIGEGFFDMDRRLKAWFTALYGLRLPVQPAPLKRHDGVGRRASFGEGFIQMPAHFPGYHGDHAEALFRASLAHIGAHVRFTRRRFEVGKLKPLQVAVVSLIEDARVEQLAIREMPGLRRLWLQFHIAEASGVLTAESRFARLARALIDPHFEDPDGWVRKGRDLFLAAEPEWENSATSRAIGNLLGNDLGQLRIQFNAKSYVVQPPYRDDNLGLWAFPEDENPPQEQSEILLETARLRENTRSDQPDRTRNEPDDPADRTSVKPRAPDDPESGMPVARYPEYDYETRSERPDWTTVVEYPARRGPGSCIETIRDRHQDLIRRITAVIRSARVSRAQREKRQSDGEILDIDACIDALAALKAGEMPDPGVYQTVSRRRRDLAVSVLLDVSASTADPVGTEGATVLDLLRESTVVLSHAMATLGDPFSLAAFSSNGREDVRYTRIKEFGQPFDTSEGAALAGLSAGYSTRLGAALRHAGAGLSSQPTHRRLLLLVTDGEPSDIDCPDPRYLQEDARRAVQGLAARGMDVFCVGVGGANTETERRIFGRRGFVQIGSVDALPEKLAAIYMQLTA